MCTNMVLHRWAMYTYTSVFICSCLSFINEMVAAAIFFTATMQKFYIFFKSSTEHVSACWSTVLTLGWAWRGVVWCFCFVLMVSMCRTPFSFSWEADFYWLAQQTMDQPADLLPDDLMDWVPFRPGAAAGGADIDPLDQPFSCNDQEMANLCGFNHMPVISAPIHEVVASRSLFTLFGSFFSTSSHG